MSSKPGSLTPDDFPRPQPGDARREVRVPNHKPLAILPCKAAVSGEVWHFITAELVDCSLSGLGLISPVHLEKGEEFLVKFKKPGVRLLQYTVRHCVEIEGKYRIGAEFAALAGTPNDTDRQPVLDELLSSD